MTGPQSRSEQGHTYIVTCVDAFTKWAEAFPLRSKELEPLSKVLVEQVFCRLGSPVSLLSDQGKEVDGNIMKRVCRMLGADKLRTSPYKPSTNQVERLHRFVNAILGKTVASHQKDWDTRLSFAIGAYRAASLSIFIGTSTVPIVALRLSGSSALCRARFPMMDRELCRAMG